MRRDRWRFVRSAYHALRDAARRLFGPAPSWVRTLTALATAPRLARPAWNGEG